jgi:hypothetical protein
MATNNLITKEHKENAVNFVFKSILGFIPGGHIVDELASFRSSVQQERLNKFSEYLRNGFEDITGKVFEPESLKSIQFIDAFESIMKKVASTSSEEKLKRYRNVLLKVMYQKTESEMFFKYLGLIDEISETQILILRALSANASLSESDIMRYLSNPEKWHDYLLNLLEKNEFTLYNGQTISTSEVTFFIYELKSKGIISLVPEPPRQVQYGATPAQPKEIYKTSPIGKEFLDFIREYGK